MTIVQNIVVISASQSWPLSQLDENNALLYGDLKKENLCPLLEYLKNPIVLYVV